MNAYLDPAGDAHSDILNTAQGLWCPSHPGEYISGPSEIRYQGNPIPHSTSASTHGNLAAYGINFMYIGGRLGYNAKNWFYRKKSFVNFPSNIIIHADNAHTFTTTNTAFHYWARINRTDGIEEPFINAIPEFREELKFPIGDRHFQGANAGCLDGHVEWQTQRTWHHAESYNRWLELHTKSVYPFDIDG